jgi:asparagine synthase (glutamine-hydrolysing)
MFRYVILIWDEATEEASFAALAMERRLLARSEAWRVEFCGAGVRVMTADKSRALAAYALHGSAGVVLGEIFVRQSDIESDAVSVDAVFGECETNRLLQTQGRVLTEQYWGNYVAVLVDPAVQLRWVLKDPTGQLPCYFTEHRGVRVIFSCLPDCFDLGLGRFRVNEAFLRSRTLSGGLDVETNSLQGIDSVHRGECVRFDQRGGMVARSFYWHPSRYEDPALAIECPERAARALRATVRGCVHSLASHHSSVLQQISGGLDSSIVLGCLSEAPNKPDVTCYCGYVPGHPSDERRWARLAAEKSGFRYLELACEPRRVDFRHMPILAPSVEPESYFFHWQKGLTERVLVDEVEATGVFTGEGGDSVLCSTSYSFAVDSAWRRYGLSGRTFKIAMRVAARRDRTIWTVLYRAMKRRWLGERPDDHRALTSGTSSLAHADAVKLLDGANHFPNPWFSAMERVSLETVWRLGTLAFAPMFYDLSISHDGAAAPLLSPLCAQPAFEICRRIPVDVHFDGGRTRGLARRAFTHEVPQPILRRQWKDRPMSQVNEIVQLNLEFIREALLDGQLTQRGILDRASVEMALKNGPSRSRALSGEILRHMDLELWSRQGL